MSTRFVIESGEIGAGIVIRERAGFRFFAAAPPFFRLDGQCFKTLREAERAVARLAAA
jgi:hypothetical protein